MKYLLLFISLAIIFSCSKETTPPKTDISDERRSKMDAFMKGSIEVDFKSDYRVSKLNEGVPPNVAPLLEERKLTQYASSNSGLMLQKYPEVKSTLSDWINQNENDRYTWAIQNTSLKYLRRLFLLENQSASVSEISFLLKILIDTKSVDLDVLADAFHHCHLDLSSSDKNRYFSYIKDLYYDEVEVIRTNGPKFKEKYEESTGPTRMKYLAYGKDLERRSKACLHTRELLGIEIVEVSVD